MSEELTIESPTSNENLRIQVLKDQEGDLSIRQAGQVVYVPKAMSLTLFALLAAQAEDDAKAWPDRTLPSGTLVRDTDEGTEFEFPNGLGILLVEPKDREGDIRLVMDRGPECVFMPAADVEHFSEALKKAAL